MKELILGENYETIESLMDKVGVTSNKAIYLRIEKLKSRGIDLSERFHPDTGKRIFYKVDADKIINFKRKKRYKDIPGYKSFPIIVKESGLTIMSIYSRISIIENENDIEIKPEFYENSVAYYSLENADRILNFKNRGSVC